MKQTDKTKLYEEIVAQVKQDFKNRQEARLPFELNWQLNMNFVAGNQYCQINGKGDVVDNAKQYFWEEREVYNHIALCLTLFCIYNFQHHAYF